jgi:hypothetical protein
MRHRDRKDPRWMDLPRLSMQFLGGKPLHGRLAVQSGLHTDAELRCMMRGLFFINGWAGRHTGRCFISHHVSGHGFR